MKIKMITDAKGSEDGCTVRLYEQGKTYNMQDDLARVFVDQMRVAALDDKLETLELKFEIPEKSYKRITVNDRPKKWIGMEIRERATGTWVSVVDVQGADGVHLSDGRVIHYRTIRRDFDNGD